MNSEAEDIKAIERVVAAVELTQRGKDVEGFLTLFHPPTADWLRTPQGGPP